MITEFVFVCAKMEITQSKTNLLSISQKKSSMGIIVAWHHCGVHDLRSNAE